MTASFDIDVDALREDARKVAVGLILGGGLGFFSDHIGSGTAFSVACVGCCGIVSGSVKPQNGGHCRCLTG